VEGIEVEQGELQNETMRTVDNLYRIMPKKEARKLNQPRVLNNLVGNIMADLLTQKAMKHLRDSSRGVLAEQAEEQTAAEAETAAEPQEQASEAPEAAAVVEPPEPVAETTDETGETEEKA
jgi:hypothetical protein